MLSKYIIEKSLDDHTILNNLDVFKAQLIAQAQYCDDVQNEMRVLNEKLYNREKKYQRLKADFKNIVDKNVRLESENAGLKSQLDVYKMLMNNQLIFGNHLVQVNRPVVNNIQSVPSPPPPPPKCVEDISIGTQSRPARSLDNVLEELRSKIKLVQS